MHKSFSDLCTHMFMSSTIESLPDSPIPEQSLLPWPENRDPEHAIHSNEWENFPHPKELEYLPDGPQTAHELKQIVKRSLYRCEPQPAQPRRIERNVHLSDGQWDLASEPLPVVPGNQSQKSSVDVDLRTTHNHGDATQVPAVEDTASLIPSLLNVPAQPLRELIPKSSFLFSKIERLGAKIEKLEFASTRRSSRNSEENKVIATV